MKSIKKLTAALLAVSSMTAVTASLNSAFAYEGLSLEEEQLVASYESSNAQRVAEYCLNVENWSIEQTKAFTDEYVEASSSTMLARTASGANDPTVVDAPYYNPTALSTQKHYVLAIAINPSIAFGIRNSFYFDFYNGVTYSGNDRLLYPGTVRRYSVDPSSYMGIGVNFATYALSTTTSCAIASYELDISDSDITSEQQLYGSIALTSNGNVAYETYAVGDVNHDGILNADDSELLTNYIVGIKHTLACTYSDGSNHYSYVTNCIAADFDEDGSLTLSDVVGLNELVTN